MRPQSSLTAAQRLTALDLFEEGFGYYAVASKLNVSAKAARSLRERFMIWGRATLESKPTRPMYSFEFKLALVRQFLNGEGTQSELALKHELSSPTLLRTWVHTYRIHGEDGLQPKAKGRPKSAPPTPSGEVSELEKLRPGNQRLLAENAYLKKHEP